MGTEGEERRAAPRAPLAVRVLLGRKGESLEGYHARDLSAAGVFVFTSDPLDVDAEVGMELELPGDEPIPVSGVIVRTQIVQGVAERPGLSGMAIRFKDLIPQDEARLVKLVDAVNEAIAATHE